MVAKNDHIENDWPLRFSDWVIPSAYGAASTVSNGKCLP